MGSAISKAQSDATACNGYVAKLKSTSDEWLVNYLQSISQATTSCASAAQKKDTAAATAAANSVSEYPAGPMLLEPASCSAVTSNLSITEVPVLDLQALVMPRHHLQRLPSPAVGRLPHQLLHLLPPHAGLDTLLTH